MEVELGLSSLTSSVGDLLYPWGQRRGHPRLGFIYWGGRAIWLRPHLLILWVWMGREVERQVTVSYG